MIKYKNRFSAEKDSKANFLFDCKQGVCHFTNKRKARRVNTFNALYYTYKDFLDRLYATYFARRYTRGNKRFFPTETKLASTVITIANS